MIKRTLLAALLALALALTGCGGSAEAPAPGPAAINSNVITEADAISKAQAAASAEGLSSDGLDITATNIFGEWQVSFEGDQGLAGGFLVMLEAETGDLVEIVPYQ